MKLNDSKSMERIEYLHKRSKVIEGGDVQIAFAVDVTRLHKIQVFSTWPEPERQ